MKNKAFKVTGDFFKRLFHQEPTLVDVGQGKLSIKFDDGLVISKIVSGKWYKFVGEVYIIDSVTQSKYVQDNISDYGMVHFLLPDNSHHARPFFRVRETFYEHIGSYKSRELESIQSIFRVEELPEGV